MLRSMSDQNPYAPPIHDDQEPLPRKTAKGAKKGKKSLAWREGDCAVMNNDAARLPKRCVVCNAKVDGDRTTRQFMWHPQWVYFTLLVAPIVYAVAAAATRKSVKVEMGLCYQHQVRRRNGLFMAWGGGLLSLLLIVLGASTDTGALILFGVLMMLVMPLTGARIARVAYPSKITDTRIWLKVGEPFLASLPERYEDGD
jgi:hypothetical protein